MPGANTNVLVIDDDKLSRMVIEDVLKSAGLRVALADSATRGLELAFSIKPGFIIMEQALEDMKALELIRELRSHDRTKRIPFAVVTGVEDPIQKELSMRAGALDVIYKPFNCGEFVSFVKGHLRKMRQTGRRILLVEDSGTIRAITRHLLERQGHTVIETTDGVNAWEALNDHHADVDMIVTDINMPRMDGRQLVEKIRNDERFQFIPVIVSTTITEKENVKLLLNMGADDYITKPFSTEEFVARVQSHLRVKSLYEDLRKVNKRLAEFNETLETRVLERTRELKEANMSAIYSLATAAEAKDQDTGYHVHRIQHYSEALAIRLGFSEVEAEEIGYSSIMHDVGKLSIPDKILKKPAKLTKEEFEIIKTHSVHGEKILPDTPFFALARKIARAHHEKWDGKGYPDQLSEKQIPISARIVAVADVFDALINARVYKQAWPLERAIEEMRSLAGSHFDPTIIKALLELHEEGELENIYSKWR